MIQPSQRARVLVLSCHAALLVSLPLLAGWAGLVLIVPLLAFAPGLWRGTPRRYAAASLLVVFYAGGGLMEAFSIPGATSRFGGALAFAAIAALEFCGLIVFVRLRAAEARRSQLLAREA